MDEAGWCFRATLDGICEALDSAEGGHELAEELRAEHHRAQWPQHFEVKDWSEKKKSIFREATRMSYEKAKAVGPVGWHDPSFFPGYLRALEELVEMLDTSRR